MQPSKPSNHAVSNTGSSSSQPNPVLSDVLQLWIQYPDDLLNALGFPSQGTDFTFDSGQHSSGNLFSAQTDDDYREYELPAHDQIHPTTSTPEHSTPDENQHGPLTPGINDVNVANGYAGGWEADFLPYADPFDQPVAPTETSPSSNEPLYPTELSIQPLSAAVAEEEHHGNDTCHEDQPSPIANSVVDIGMTDWRRQAQQPSFRVNICSPPLNSPGEEPTRRSRRRRRLSSEQESRRPKRQRSSQEGSPALLGVGHFSQDRGEAVDIGFANQSIVRNHSQIRTAPGAIAVGDLFHVATQDQELPTRKTRASSLSQEGHPCPVCKRPFKRERDIPRHIHSVHGEERIQCEYCNKTYTRDDSLKRHYPSCPNKPKES